MQCGPVEVDRLALALYLIGLALVCWPLAKWLYSEAREAFRSWVKSSDLLAALSRCWRRLRD